MSWLPIIRKVAPISRPTKRGLSLGSRRSTGYIEELEPRLALSASPVGTDVLVSQQSHGKQELSRGATSVAALADGAYVVAYNGWGAADRDGVLVQRMSSAGQAEGTAILANETLSGHQGAATIAARPDGGFIVVWEGRGAGDRDGIFARIFGADGQPATHEFRVNETIGGSQRTPVVVVAPAGIISVAWTGAGQQDAQGVFLRRFDAVGQPLGPEALVNAASVLAQDHVALVQLPAGETLVAWASRGQDGSGWGIYARHLGADGVPSRSEVSVNSTTESDQRFPRAVLTPDNRILMAWSSSGQHGEGGSIVGRILNTTGDTVSGELTMTPVAALDKVHAQLATWPDGQVTEVWQGALQDESGWGVQGRNFTPAGAPLGDAYGVNDFTSASQILPSIAIGSASRGLVVWCGSGEGDRYGIYATLLQKAPLQNNHAPKIASIENVTAAVGTELVIHVNAIDEDGDELTFQLDPESGPSGATITKIGTTEAIVRWTPAPGDLSKAISLAVLVTDNGVPTLADAEWFTVTVE